MRSAHRITETPKERLQRVASYALPRVRQVSKRNYLIGVALLVMLLALLLVAWVGGSSAAELMRGYAERIMQSALPFGR